MVEQTEIPESVHEQHEHAVEHADNAFRRWAAIYVGVVAMVLAISSLGGGHATKEMLSANIHASDMYAFAQAKYARQVAYELAADQLDLQLAAQPSLPDEVKATIGAAIKRYRETAARYESDPVKGEGRKELIAKAHVWEHERDHAAAQDPNFEFAAALFQIAIVLGSVSIVAVSRLLIGLSAALAVAGSALTINGYFLIVPLSFG
jgi:hypothetical protein